MLYIKGNKLDKITKEESTDWKKKKFKQRALGHCDIKRKERRNQHRPGRNGGENGEPVVSLRPSTEIIPEEGSDRHVQCY